MTKITIEIEDDLQERIDGCVEEMVEKTKEWVEENPDHECTDAWDFLSEIDYDGRVHETIDSWVPIYHKNINDLWYLYSSELEEAFEFEGLGDASDFENYKQMALYCYIRQQSYSTYEEHEEIRKILDEIDEDYLDD